MHHAPTPVSSLNSGIELAGNILKDRRQTMIPNWILNKIGDLILGSIMIFCGGTVLGAIGHDLLGVFGVHIGVDMPVMVGISVFGAIMLLLQVNN